MTSCSEWRAVRWLRHGTGFDSRGLRAPSAMLGNMKKRDLMAPDTEPTDF